MSHDTEASPGDVVRQEPHRDVPAGCPQQQRFPEEQGGDGPRLWDRDHQPVLRSAGSALSGNHDRNPDGRFHSVWDVVEYGNSF